MTRFQTTYNRYKRSGSEKLSIIIMIVGLPVMKRKMMLVTIIRALNLFIKTSLDPVEEHDQRHMIYFGLLCFHFEFSQI